MTKNNVFRLETDPQGKKRQEKSAWNKHFDDLAEQFSLGNLSFEYDKEDSQAGYRNVRIFDKSKPDDIMSLQMGVDLSGVSPTYYMVGSSYDKNTAKYPFARQVNVSGNEKEGFTFKKYNSAQMFTSHVRNVFGRQKPRDLEKSREINRESSLLRSLQGDGRYFMPVPVVQEGMNESTSRRMMNAVMLNVSNVHQFSQQPARREFHSRIATGYDKWFSAARDAGYFATAKQDTYMMGVGQTWVSKEGIVKYTQSDKVGKEPAAIGGQQAIPYKINPDGTYSKAEPENSHLSEVYGYTQSSILYPNESLPREQRNVNMVFTQTPFSGGAFSFINHDNDGIYDFHGNESSKKAKIPTDDLRDLVSGKTSFDFSDVPDKYEAGEGTISMGKLEIGNKDVNLVSQKSTSPFLVTGRKIEIPKYWNPYTGEGYHSMPKTRSLRKGIVPTTKLAQTIKEMHGIDVVTGTKNQARLITNGITELFGKVKGLGYKMGIAPTGMSAKVSVDGDYYLNVDKISSEMKDNYVGLAFMATKTPKQLKEIISTWADEQGTDLSSKTLLAHQALSPEGQAFDFNDIARHVGYKRGGASLAYKIFSETFNIDHVKNKERNERNWRMWQGGKLPEGTEQSVGAFSQDHWRQMKDDARMYLKVNGKPSSEQDALDLLNINYRYEKGDDGMGELFLNLSGKFAMRTKEERIRDSVHRNRISQYDQLSLSEKYPLAAKEMGIDVGIPGGAKHIQSYISFMGHQNDLNDGTPTDFPEGSRAIVDAQRAISMHQILSDKEIEDTEKLDQLEELFGDDAGKNLYFEGGKVHAPSIQAVRTLAYEDDGHVYGKLPNKTLEAFRDLSENEIKSGGHAGAMPIANNLLDESVDLLGRNRTDAVKHMMTKANVLGASGQYFNPGWLKAGEIYLPRSKREQVFRDAGFSNGEAIDKADTLFGKRMITSRNPRLSGNAWNILQIVSDDTIKDRLANTVGEENVDAAFEFIQKEQEGHLFTSNVFNKSTIGDSDSDQLMGFLAGKVTRWNNGDPQDIVELSPKAMKQLPVSTYESIDADEKAMFGYDETSIANASAGVETMEDTYKDFIFSAGKKGGDKPYSEWMTETEKMALNKTLGMSTSYNVGPAIVAAAQVRGGHQINKSISGLQTLYQPHLDMKISGKEAQGSNIPQMVAASKVKIDTKDNAFLSSYSGKKGVNAVRLYAKDIGAGKNGKVGMGVLKWVQDLVRKAVSPTEMADGTKIRLNNDQQLATFFAFDGEVDQLQDRITSSEDGPGNAINRYLSEKWSAAGTEQEKYEVNKKMLKALLPTSLLARAYSKSQRNISDPKTSPQLVQDVKDARDGLSAFEEVLGDDFEDIKATATLQDIERRSPWDFKPSRLLQAIGRTKDSIGKRRLKAFGKALGIGKLMDESEARALKDELSDNKIEVATPEYIERRNNPQIDNGSSAQSGMIPRKLSPIEILKKVGGLEEISAQENPPIRELPHKNRKVFVPESPLDAPMVLDKKLIQENDVREILKPVKGLSQKKISSMISAFGGESSLENVVYDAANTKNGNTRPYTVNGKTINQTPSEALQRVSGIGRKTAQAISNLKVTEGSHPLWRPNVNKTDLSKRDLDIVQGPLYNRPRVKPAGYDARQKELSSNPDMLNELLEMQKEPLPGDDDYEPPTEDDAGITPEYKIPRASKVGGSAASRQQQVYVTQRAEPPKNWSSTEQKAALVSKAISHFDQTKVNVKKSYNQILGMMDKYNIPSVDDSGKKRPLIDGFNDLVRLGKNDRGIQAELYAHRKSAADASKMLDLENRVDTIRINSDVDESLFSSDGYRAMEQGFLLRDFDTLGKAYDVMATLHGSIANVGTDVPQQMQNMQQYAESDDVKEFLEKTEHLSGIEDEKEYQESANDVISSNPHLAEVYKKAKANARIIPSSDRDELLPHQLKEVLNRSSTMLQSNPDIMKPKKAKKKPFDPLEAEQRAVKLFTNYDSHAGNVRKSYERIVQIMDDYGASGGSFEEKFADLVKMSSEKPEIIGRLSPEVSHISKAKNILAAEKKVRGIPDGAIPKEISDRESFQNVLGDFEKRDDGSTNSYAIDKLGNIQGVVSRVGNVSEETLGYIGNMSTNHRVSSFLEKTKAIRNPDIDIYKQQVEDLVNTNPSIGETVRTVRNLTAGVISSQKGDILPPNIKSVLETASTMESVGGSRLFSAPAKSNRSDQSIDTVSEKTIKLFDELSSSMKKLNDVSEGRITLTDKEKESLVDLVDKQHRALGYSRIQDEQGFIGKDIEELTNKKNKGQISAKELDKLSSLTSKYSENSHILSDNENDQMLPPPEIPQEPQQNTTSPWGRTARAALSGFGMMYMRSIGGYITSGIGRNQKASYAYQEGIDKHISLALGKATKTYDPEQALQTQLGLTGYNVDSFASSKRWIDEHAPVLSDAGNLVKSGAGAFGATLWGASLTSQTLPALSATLGKAAPIIGGVVAAANFGAQVYEGTQDKDSLAYRISTTYDRNNNVSLLDAALKAKSFASRAFLNKDDKDYVDNQAERHNDIRMSLFGEAGVSREDEEINNAVMQSMANQGSFNIPIRIGTPEQPDSKAIAPTPRVNFQGSDDFNILVDELTKHDDLNRYTSSDYAAGAQFLYDNQNADLATSENAYRIANDNASGLNTHGTVIQMMRSAGMSNDEIFGTNANGVRNDWQYTVDTIDRAPDEAARDKTLTGSAIANRYASSLRENGVFDTSTVSEDDKRLAEKLGVEIKDAFTKTMDAFAENSKSVSITAAQEAQQKAFDISKRVTGIGNVDAVDPTSYLNMSDEEAYATANKFNAMSNIGSQLESKGNSYQAALTQAGFASSGADISELYRNMDPSKKWAYDRLFSANPMQLAFAAKNGANLNDVNGALTTMNGTNISGDFLAMTDTDLNGNLTGLSWGQSSLTLGGRNPQQVAQMIWGSNPTASGFNSKAIDAAINGYQLSSPVQLPDGTQIDKIGGIAGLQMQQAKMQREWSSSYQSRSSDISYAFSTGVGLSSYNTINPQNGSKFNLSSGGLWGIQDSQMKLNWQQQEWNMELAKKQREMSSQNFSANQSLNAQGRAMSRDWAREDWSYQSEVRDMKWDWSQEDFAEEKRFMSGRTRRKAETQNDRNTRLHNVESEHIDELQSRKEESWELEDERVRLQQEQFKKSMELQEESADQQEKFFEKRKQLEIAQQELVRAQFVEQHKLQLENIDFQKKMSIEQAKTNEQISVFMEHSSGMMNTLTGDAMTAYAAYAQINQELLKSVDLADKLDDSAARILAGKTSTTTAAIPEYLYPNSYHANGGTLSGSVDIVGEEGWEYVVGDNVIPHNESVNLAKSGELPNPSIIPSSDPILSSKSMSDYSEKLYFPSKNQSDNQSSAGSSQIVKIYIGNEHLGDFVIDAVTKEITI